MNTRAMDRMLAEMTPTELVEADCFVAVFEASGEMERHEADEWRRRILAWRRFVLGLHPSPLN